MPGGPDPGNGDPDWQAQKLLILLSLPLTPIFSFSVDLYTPWMVSILLPESIIHGD